jgi:DNA-binding NarL/FixJ family response regulator
MLLGKRGLTDLQGISHLRAILPDIRIIVLVPLDVSGYRHAALAAGAHEFVAKDALTAKTPCSIKCEGRRIGRSVR